MSSTIKQAMISANLPRALRPLFADAAAQVLEIRGLATLLNLDYEIAKQRFTAYVASRPWSWRQCALAVHHGLPSAIKAMVGDADFPVVVTDKLLSGSIARLRMTTELNWAIKAKTVQDAIEAMEEKE